MLSGVVSGKQSFGKGATQAHVDTEKVVQNYILFNLAKYGLTSTGDPNQDLININEAKKNGTTPKALIPPQNQYPKNPLADMVAKAYASQSIPVRDQATIIALSQKFANEHPDIYRQALEIHNKQKPDTLAALDPKAVVKGAGIALEALQVLMTAYQLYEKASNGESPKQKLNFLA